MNNLHKDLITGIGLIKNEGFTFAAINGESLFTSRKRGVAPLLELLENSVTLERYSASDKVVGMAAAYLYVLLKIERVYAMTVSGHALKVFSKCGIEIHFENKVDAIRNRTDTGFCPMEQAVMNAKTPKEALGLINKQLSELNSKK